MGWPGGSARTADMPPRNDWLALAFVESTVQVWPASALYRVTICEEPVVDDVQTARTMIDAEVRTGRSGVLEMSQPGAARSDSDQVRPPSVVRRKVLVRPMLGS